MSGPRRADVWHLLRHGALVVDTPPGAPVVRTTLLLDGDAATEATRPALADPSLLAAHRRAVGEAVDAATRLLDEARFVVGALFVVACGAMALGFEPTWVDGVLALVSGVVLAASSRLASRVGHRRAGVALRVAAPGLLWLAGWRLGWEPVVAAGRPAFLVAAGGVLGAGVVRLALRGVLGGALPLP